MQSSILSILTPAKFLSYEETQRARVLHVMLLAALVGGMYFAFQNIVFADSSSAVSFFVLAVLSFIALILNRYRHFRSAALLFGATLLGVLDFALYEGKASLHDPGIVVYPIFILCATFLFKKQGLVLSIFFSMISVALLYLLEITQVFTPLYPSTLNRVIGLSVLFIITALITWIINETWENHLMRLQESYDRTLQGWAKALEYRDGETEGHSQRVTRLCVALARRLGSSEEDIRHIRQGAFLHDIGKMAIPDRILFKSGPLDDDEWKIMRQHPELAVKLVSEIPFLQSAIDIVHFHHEHWDGSGYPKGLGGEEIPFAARIFTVVDQWDALTSDRPYRKAWSQEQVIAYLRENSGKIFDPKVVDVFLKIIGESNAKTL